MDVLIIGGTRFLGYHLVHRLLQEGVHVTLFHRGIHGDDFGDRVERILGDRKNYKKFYELFHRRRFDVVVDLIGYQPEDVEYAVKTFGDRVGQYIFISTGQVYLVTENWHQPAREEDYYQPLIECPPGEEAAYGYGVQKRACEDLLVEAHQFQHFPVVRFRCPIIQGPRDYTLRLYSYLKRILDGGPVILPEGGDKPIRHIYVQDVVEAIVSVFQVEKTRGKVYNLASEEVIPLRELIQMAARLLEKPVTVFDIPVSLLHEYAIPESISPFSGRWVSVLDPSLAREEIRFRSTPLQQWLSETIRWFVEEYDGPEPDNYRYRPKELELARFWRKMKHLD